MLPGLLSSSVASPCVVTHLQRHETASISKSKKSAFNNIISNPWIHRVDVILPTEVWELIERKVQAGLLSFNYFKVSMTLLQIVSGDFFNEHIKTGNILMISEGRYKLDNRFCLKDGILSLELDKSTYEQCGLVGKPIRGLGRVHVKARFLVVINLRQPSMVKGKKAFNRMIWAFTRVLIDSLKWLFVDLQRSETSPIMEFTPSSINLEPNISTTQGSFFPWVDSVEALHDQTYQEQLLEWIGLVLMDSSRLSAKDDIDSYLCRYTLPEAFEATHQVSQIDLTHLCWNGLIPARFVRELLAILEPTLHDKPHLWFALGSKGFEERTCFSIQKGRDVLSWDMP